MMRRAILFLTIVLAVGCHDKEPATTGINYLNEVLDVMEKNSVKRKKIDWPTFRAQVLDQAAGARSIADVYPAIKFAIAGLGDYHTTYAGTSATIYSPVKHCIGVTNDNAPQAGIGYIKIRPFYGLADQANRYAIAIQDTIRMQDNANLYGWIIDLRGNVGGNMWAMLAGAGPILGEGICGYFVDPDGNAETWEYNNGDASDGGSAFCTVTQPYTLIKQKPKVAVIVNQATWEIGEAIAIAFIGRPNTKLFGKPTCGISTGSDIFPLSDGANLFLANGVMTDRNKNGNGDSIAPDFTISNESDIFPQAVQWLKTP